MWKKWISGILIFMIGVSVTAFAKENSSGELPAVTEYTVLYPEGTGFPEPFLLKEPEAISEEPTVFVQATAESLEDYLNTKIMNMKTEGRISVYQRGYRIRKEDFSNIYYGLAMRHPEWMVKTGYGYNTYSGYVYEIQPLLLISGEDIVSARQEVESGIESYVAIGEQYDTPLEQLLSVHDEMVKNCRYDYDMEKGDASYHSYGFLKNNLAVCQGYAQLFYAVITRLGLEADFCRSNEINHIWNYVKLNGAWYHVDVTWDDPIVVDQNGNRVNQTTAYHSNFLIDDTRKRENILESYPAVTGADWINFEDQTIPCTDCRYEHGYLFNAPFPFTMYQNDEGAYEVNINQVVFSAENLRCGSILVAKEIEGTSNTPILYYYCMEDTINKVGFVRQKKQNGMQTGLNISHYDEKSQNTIYSIQMNALQNDGEESVYFWNLDTFEPYSEKRIIAHE